MHTNKKSSYKGQKKKKKSFSFHQICSQHKQMRNCNFNLKKQKQGILEMKSPLEIISI